MNDDDDQDRSVISYQFGHLFFRIQDSNRVESSKQKCRNQNINKKTWDIICWMDGGGEWEKRWHRGDRWEDGNAFPIWIALLFTIYSYPNWFL